jgi:hypothetical protein
MTSSYHNVQGGTDFALDSLTPIIEVNEQAVPENQEAINDDS